MGGVCCRGGSSHGVREHAAPSTRQDEATRRAESQRSETLIQPGTSRLITLPVLIRQRSHSGSQSAAALQTELRELDEARTSQVAADRCIFLQQVSISYLTSLA